MTARWACSSSVTTCLCSSSNCDRIAIMYAGRVVEQGEALDLFEHPAHPYTRALMGAFPTIGDEASRYAPSRAWRVTLPSPETCPRVARSTPMPACHRRVHEVDVQLQPVGRRTVGGLHSCHRWAVAAR